MNLVLYISYSVRSHLSLIIDKTYLKRLAMNFFFFLSWWFHIACKVNAQVFEEFFVYYYYYYYVFILPVCIFLKLLPSWEGFERRLSWNFWKISSQIGTFRFSTLDVYITAIRRWYLYCMIYVTLPSGGKKNLKKFQLVREICKHLCSNSWFCSLRSPKGIACLCFHYSSRFTSFACRNFIFLVRFRNTMQF